MAFAIKAGEDADAIRRQIPRSDEIPFDAAHRFMATLHHAHTDGAVAYVKGRPSAFWRCETTTPGATAGSHSTSRASATIGLADAGLSA